MVTFTGEILNGKLQFLCSVSGLYASPLHILLTSAYQGVKMFVFRKIWRALFSWNTRFEIRPFVLLPTCWWMKLKQKLSVWWESCHLLNWWRQNEGRSSQYNYATFLHSFWKDGAFIMNRTETLTFFKLQLWWHYSKFPYTWNEKVHSFSSNFFHRTHIPYRLWTRTKHWGRKNSLKML